MWMSSILMAFFIIYTSLAILAKKTNWYYFLLAVLIFSCLLYFKFEIDYYRIISNYFILVIIIYLLTKEELLKIFLACFFVYFIIAVAEIIFFIFLSYFEKEITISFWTNLGIIVIAFFIYYSFRFYWQRINKLNFKNNFLISFFVIALIIMLAFFVHRLYFLVSFWGNVFVSILGIIILLIFLVIILKERQSYLWLIDEYKKFYGDRLVLEEELLQYRMRQHDYNNEMLYFKTLVDDKEGRSFFDKKIAKPEKLFLKSDVQSFVENKIAEMEEAGVKVAFCWHMKLLFNNDWEFNNKVIRILANLLDNAKEASLKLPNARVEILVWEEKDNVVFSIANNYKGKIILDKIFRCNASGNGVKRGFGLYLVQRLITKEKDCFLQSRIVGSMFYQELFIRRSRFFEIK